ncbi:preprotein translocase subunit YajC [Sedimentisphaera salicampi]|uniref:Sec translocon accessory complex subunit YajC n=1 Tax=Sedimentisphaera salicampi TaxID=1941349 RepID=A0A1W6LNK0_9BACT|nr:preprotein translocase subunit YajC [Sedimentisphaera salicampi]ARN57358.1 preprotein translocase subunit YajC [Sedimentisphaera salicampi]OXU14563.1 preprotein translocase subunit YajC [Sedimentisphaera salicampi]
MRNLWVLAAADPASGENTVTMEQVDGSTSTNSTAESTGKNGAEGTGEQQAPQGMPPGQILLLVGLLVMMYFVLFHGPRKQQKKQQQMRDSLNKNDRVVTIGGIYGTILEIKDGMVTLKVDESTNAKVKMKLTAIAGKAEEKQA